MTDTPNQVTNKPIVLLPERGILRYMTNSITWSPIYDLYLDTIPTIDSAGLLSLAAQIKNQSGSVIDAGKCILLSGNARMEYGSGRSYETYASRSVAKVASNSNSSVDSTVGDFDEMLSFDIGGQLLNGQTIIKPLAEYTIDSVTKKYTINLDSVSDSQYRIEANYGYTFSGIDADLPPGLLRIYAKSPDLGANMLLGSVSISRTPAGEEAEAMVGTTSRVRAKVTTSTQTEDFIIHSISHTRITGKITNDYDHTLPLILRTYIGFATITHSKPSLTKKGNHVEWYVKLRPGSTQVDIQFTAQS